MTNTRKAIPAKRLVLRQYATANETPQTDRLMTALSSRRRKTRGLAFPGCGKGVTEPISTKSKPIRRNPATASPFLSNPAAMPSGEASSWPKNVVFYEKKQTMAGATSGHSEAGRGAGSSRPQGPVFPEAPPSGPVGSRFFEKKGGPSKKLSETNKNR